MISIIIPCYNDNNIVGRAVQSALMQFLEKEIIVVDDGSTEPVRNIWGDPVRVIRHTRNMGLSHALNTGISKSKYDKFVICAADDELAPSYLQQAIIRSEDIVSCDMAVGGKRVKSMPGSLEQLKMANCHPYAAVVKKELWKKVGGFNPHMNPSQEDWEFFLNCAKHGASWFHLSKVGLIYHRNPQGRDQSAQGKDRLLNGKRQGFHQDLFGKGAGHVSIVIPCYNQEQYLHHSIGTSLAQTYPHVDVIVVDDGSPGNVVGTISKLKTDFSRITVVRQHNKHLSGARNTGILKAMEKFNSQYLIMLDADDGMEPSFIEETMGAMADRTYVYTNIKFIGDARHHLELNPFNCRELKVKHQHPCTFLAQSSMFLDVKNHRGYMYDETMKQGYEDWEAALAFVERGWCGELLPKYLFHYRFHENGSMRTQASEIKQELGKYIRSRHAWMLRSDTNMPCSTCGKSRYVQTIRVAGGSIMTTVHIPELGDLPVDAPIDVTYTGVTTSTMTKLGAGGKSYKYSANPDGTYGPRFTAFARDAHLFVGPFVRRLLDTQAAQEIIAASEPAMQPKPVAVQQVQPAVVPAEVVEPEFDTGKRLEAKAAARETMEVDNQLEEPDDFTIVLVKLKGIGKATAPDYAKKLVDAGITFFEDVEETAAQELAAILGISIEKADLFKEATTKYLDSQA